MINEVMKFLKRSDPDNGNVAKVVIPRKGTPEFCGTVTSGTKYWGGVIDNLIRS